MRNENQTEESFLMFCQYQQEIRKAQKQQKIDTQQFIKTTEKCFIFWNIYLIRPLWIQLILKLISWRHNIAYIWSWIVFTSLFKNYSIPFKMTHFSYHNLFLNVCKVFWLAFGRSWESTPQPHSEANRSLYKKNMLTYIFFPNFFHTGMKVDECDQGKKLAVKWGRQYLRLFQVCVLLLSQWQHHVPSRATLHTY